MNCFYSHEEEYMWDETEPQKQTETFQFLQRLVLAFLLPILGFDNKCQRCWRPMNEMCFGIDSLLADQHTVWYNNETEGCCALCETCRSELTPKQRAEYHRKVVLTETKSPNAPAVRSGNKKKWFFKITSEKWKNRHVRFAKILKALSNGK